MAACGAVGRGFESLWARLKIKKRSKSGLGFIRLRNFMTLLNTREIAIVILGLFISSALIVLAYRLYLQ
jgi:hypothetical protein